MPNLTPIALRLENFGSFKKSQTFPFPRAPGLYFMLGKNEAEPRLTGNATGKSTLWKALTWLVHGRTPEGLKAGDVCNWDVAKGVEVALETRDDGGRGLPEFVTRTWGPISWKHQDLFGNVTDLAKDPQNPVLASLRVGFEPWLCSVLMAQGEDYFLDMGKDAQAALFSSVMDLDGWVRRAERASEAARAQDGKSRRLERELADAVGRLDVLERDDSAGDADRWERKRQERLSRLEEDHRNLTDRRRGLRKALDEATGREDAARKGVAAAQPDRALEDEFAEAERELRRMEDERLAVGVRREALRDHLARLNDPARSSSCPVCNRPFDVRHWQQETERAERNLRGEEAMHAQITHKVTVARNRRDVLHRRLREQEDALEAARGAVRDAERARSIAASDLGVCDRQLDGVEDAYAEARAERNPFADAVERAAREAEALRDDVRALRRELDDSNRLHSIKTYWTRGFKEIRLREIASALSELEVEVNSCVTELGLVDWELEFSVDRETKGGGVQRGFSVLVRAPGTGGRAVPWKSWSGGEKQRLRLATNMGLANLVRTRTGCDFPLEVWDEPTNGLSPEGKTDLFAALAARARREARVIFLVDHQAHDFGGFAGTATVIKTPSGSRVRTSWA